MRWLSFISGPALVSDAIGSNPARSSIADIEAYLTRLRPLLDIDNNQQFDPATDGVLIVRYLLGFRGDALITGAVGGGAGRSNAADIEAYIQSLIP